MVNDNNVISEIYTLNAHDIQMPQKQIKRKENRKQNERTEVPM